MVAFKSIQTKAATNASSGNGALRLFLGGNGGLRLFLGFVIGFSVSFPYALFITFALFTNDASLMATLKGAASASATPTPTLPFVNCTASASSSATPTTLLPFVIEYGSLVPPEAQILLSSMEGTGKCQKTIEFEDYYGNNKDKGKNNAIEMKLAKIPAADIINEENLLCVQYGPQIGVAVGRDGRILHVSDLGSYKQWLNDQGRGQLPSYHILDLKYVIMESRYLPSTIDTNNAARKPDDNKGNFVWRFGATNIISPYTTKFVNKKDWRTSAHILASANLFLMNRKNPKGEEALSNLTKILTDRVTKYDLPSIVLGIGVQVEFSQIKNVSEISLDGYDVYKQLLLEYGSRHEHKSIAVRGEVTETACKNSGITQCISMGCPSLTISRDMNLGQTLQTKWDEVITALQTGGDDAKKLKVVLTLPAIGPSNPNYGRILDMLLSLFKQHDSYFIMQTPVDRPNLMQYTNNTLDPSRLVIFEDQVESWLEFISGMDFVVSARIHGGMVGISNQVPAVVIPTDFRILELCDVMKLPTLPMDKVVNAKNTSLLQLMQDIPVDYQAFEMNRRSKVREYKRMVEGIGLEMEPNLVAIANQP